MNNHCWVKENGEVYKCSQCENYIPGEKFLIKCLACRHAYGADTDEDADDMDYPKPDLFKRKQQE